MAGRIRSQRPEVLSDAPNATLTDAAFRLKVGLALLADDAGRVPASAAYLAGAVFWGRPRAEAEVERALLELVAARQLRLYENGGVRYAAIVGWTDRRHVNYQRIEKPSPTRTPEPPPEDSGNVPGILPEDSGNVPGILPEDSGNVPGGIGIREREEERDRDQEREGESEGQLELGQAGMKAEPETELDPEPLARLALEIANAAVETINRLAGTRFDISSDIVQKNAKALAKAKRSADDVRSVVESKWQEWRSSESMRPQFKPSVLLRPSNFSKYLEELRAGVHVVERGASSALEYALSQTRPSEMD